MKIIEITERMLRKAERDSFAFLFRWLREESLISEEHYKIFGW